jgi:hypothetical protein|nr:MAG TPA_asm: hypothetical protein [Caudoviricetes sp.]
MCKHTYYFIRILVIYLFVLSLGYNIYQNATIAAYEQNFDGFLQEIIDLRSKK